MERIPLIQQRNLALVPFPFSDQSGKKVRPVIIISNQDYNEHSEDLIVIAVTSQVDGPNRVVILPEDIEIGEIKGKSCIKVDNILKISKSLIIKSFGRVSKRKHQDILAHLVRLLN